MSDIDDIPPVAGLIPASTDAPGPDQAPDSPRFTPHPSLLGRTSRTILLAALILQTVVVGVLYVPIPPNPDHEVFDYMAWSSLEKGGLYRNGGDTNMPGEAILHIASMKLFGNHFWSYRLLDYLLLVGFSASVALMTGRDYGKTFAGLFFGLYLIVYTTSGYWMTGQRDMLATHGILLAGLTYIRWAEGGRVSWLILSGLAIAAAVLLKPTFLAFVPILPAMVAFFVRRGIKAVAFGLAVQGIVGAIVLGALLLQGWATASLKAWHEMTFVYSLQNYVGGADSITIFSAIVETSFKSWHWYLVMAIAGLLCFVIEPRKAPLAVILAVLATVFVSTFAQGKGFGYHFAGLLSVISLFDAFYLTQLLRMGLRIEEPRRRFLVLSFPLLLLAGGLFSKCYSEFKPQVRWYLDSSQFSKMLNSRRFDDVMEASRYVRSATRPDQTVWNYNTHSMINSLADRSMPIRMIAPLFLRSTKVSPLTDEWRREIESIFRDQPPELIVLEVKDFSEPDVFAYFDDIQPYEPVSALKKAVDHLYVLDRRIGRFAFFRKDEAKFAEAARAGHGASAATATIRPN